MYGSGGNYQVTLTAFKDGNQESITKTVSVYDAPSTMSIESVTISNFPFTDQGGSGWDLTSGPDVFFTIETQGGSILSDGTNSRVEDVAPGDLPLTWNYNSPFALPSLTNTYNIVVYDYDPSNADDQIGGVGIRAQNVIPTDGVDDYPTTLTSSGTVSMSIRVSWQ